MKFKYGKSFISLQLGGLPYKVLENPSRFKSCPSIKKELEFSINNPIGTKSLKELSRGKKKIVIVVSDKTRNALQKEIVSFLVSKLDAYGIKDRDITILFANGLHSGHSQKEKEFLLSKRILRNFKVVDHNAFDPKSQIYLGDTSFGTRVEVNHLVVENDLLILTGSIEPHYYAGFTGGRKALVPGVASEKTIKLSHSRYLFTKEFEGNGLADMGILNGNPVHEDMMEAVRKIRVDFLLNVVLDNQNRLMKAFCGDVEEAFFEGCEFVKDFFFVKIDEKREFVIVSAGGWPNDINYIQAHKAAHNASRATKEGGTILFIAECSQGLGAKETYWIEYDSSKEILDKIRKDYSVNGQTFYSSFKKAENFDINIFSKLKPELTDKLKLKSCKDPGAIIKRFSNRKIPAYIIPDGRVTVPRYGI